MKPLQFTLIALIASLGATAQLAQKFHLALTTKNVWLSPTLTYEASPTSSLELTLPLNSTLFLDDALGGFGIYSFYSELKTFVKRMLVLHAATQSI